MSTASVWLVTGLPGNGKTLHSICMVKELAEKENRPVFYSGIEVLDQNALPWHPIDPLKWFDAPPNSIVVIDECWKTFPVRPNGSAVPVHVERIATVRHGGIILVLITQHPSQVDLFVRRLVGRHMHHVRRFGMQACAVLEWPTVKDNCDKNPKCNLQSEWRYKKEAYAWYKSAEVHTFKAKIPKKVWFLLVIPFIVAAAIWYVWHIFKTQSAPSVPATPAVVVSVPGGRAAPAGRPGEGRPEQMTPAQWAARYEPRVRGLDYTAPAYDKVTEPVRAPYPAACVQSKTRCNCYTQQATKLAVPAELCQQIAAGGFFMAWDERAPGGAQVRPAPVPVAAGTSSPQFTQAVKFAGPDAVNVAQADTATGEAIKTMRKGAQ